MFTVVLYILDEINKPPLERLNSGFLKKILLLQ